MIRRAQESDAAGIARIYNQSMKKGIFATCDVDPVTVESRLDWLRNHQDPYPAFVMESGAEIVGWAAINKFSVRPSYPAVAEVSVYVDEDCRNGTVGGRLFLHLLEAAKRLGFRSLVSLTFAKNSPSLRGLKILGGFHEVGCLSEVALLRGEWEDVTWLQKELA